MTVVLNLLSITVFLYLFVFVFSNSQNKMNEAKHFVKRGNNLKVKLIEIDNREASIGSKLRQKRLFDASKDDKSKHSNRKRRAVVDFVTTKLNTFTIVGPQCIPLTSKSINSNPYHHSLLSIPGTQIRSGLGLPEILSMNPVSCDSDRSEIKESCKFSVTKSQSVSVSDSYSITLGSSQSFSKSIGKSLTNGNTNSYTKSIGNTIEKSLTKGVTLSDDLSLSKQVSESLQNTFERSAGISSSKQSDHSKVYTVSQDNTGTITESKEESYTETDSTDTGEISSKGGSSSNTKSESSETSHSGTVGMSVTGELDFGFVKASTTVHASYTGTSSNSESSSNTEETNWNNQLTKNIGKSQSKGQASSKSNAYATSIGRSNSRTDSFSSSSTKDNRVSDAISVGREAATTHLNSHSNSKSSTDSITNSYRIDDSFTSSEETTLGRTISNDIEEGFTVTNTTVRENTFTITLSNDITFSVPPGTCKIAVCLPFVKAIAIPFLCLNDNGSNDLIYVDYMLVEPVNNNNVSCTYKMIDCELRHSQDLFILDNKEFHNAFDENSMEFGESRADIILMSQNGKFSLLLQNDGNLVIMQYGIVVWENSMGLFTDANYTIRIRINEKGHLIEEVKGLFTNTVPDYRSNEWITVWSSAPINHNVTIGIPELPGQFISYKLVLENNGHLNLYDAVGTLIWCASHRNCNHRFGYKFPEVYLVPTNFITPKDTDKHNRIDEKVVLRSKQDSSSVVLVSLDVKCDSLMQNEGVQSANGRYKLILEDSGNLIIKDGYRTMWESASGFLSYAKPPFQLVLIPSGNLLILDSRKHIVWTTQNNKVFNTTQPYRLELLDEGRLVIKDSTDFVLWESWPIRARSFGSTLLTRCIYKYEPCYGTFKRALNSSIGDNQLLNENYLESNNRKWTFGIWNRSVVGFKFDNKLLNGGIWFEKANEINYLKFSKAGSLDVYDSENQKICSLTPDIKIDQAESYKLVLSDHGALKILDPNNKILWSNKTEAIKLFADYFESHKIDINRSKIIDEYNIVVSTLHGHNNKVNGLALLEESAELISGSTDKTIFIWNTLEGNSKRELSKSNFGWVTKVIVLPNQNVASVHNDHSIRIWDTKTNVIKYNITEFKDDILAIVALQNEELAFSYGKKIIIWQLKQNGMNRTELRGHADTVTALCLLSNKYLASGSLDGEIKIWDLAEARLVTTLKNHTSGITSLLALPNRMLASGSNDTKIIIWNLKQGTSIRTLTQHSRSVSSLMTLSDEFLVSGSSDNTICMWNMRNGYTLDSVLKGHTNTVSALVELPNRDIASASHDDTIKIWRRLAK